MPNQVKENNFEKKFKGYVFEINDKLWIISWLFVVFLLGVYIYGIWIITSPTKKKKKVWGKRSVC